MTLGVCDIYLFLLVLEYLLVSAAHPLLHPGLLIIELCPLYILAYLIGEHSGFVKHTTNKSKLLSLMAYIFTDQV